MRDDPHCIYLKKRRTQVLLFIVFHDLKLYLWRFFCSLRIMLIFFA